MARYLKETRSTRCGRSKRSWNRSGSGTTTTCRRPANHCSTERRQRRKTAQRIQKKNHRERGELRLALLFCVGLGSGFLVPTERAAQTFGEVDSWFVFQKLAAQANIGLRVADVSLPRRLIICFEMIAPDLSSQLQGLIQ